MRPAPAGRLGCCKTTLVNYPAGSPVSLTHGAACAKPALILPERDKRKPAGKPATMSRGEIMAIATWPSVGLVGVT